MLSAAVPIAGLLKSNTKVSHALATVVIASVSALIAPLLASSTLSRIGIPALGEYTLTYIWVSPIANGIALANPFPPAVVPAQVIEEIALVLLATILVPPAGSATNSE